jgi:hypothetical protein
MPQLTKHKPAFLMHGIRDLLPSLDMLQLVDTGNIKEVACL